MNGLSLESLIYHGRGPVDLAIEPGECVTLSGPSGSGKTLLLRAIADLDPCEGDIHLGDTSVRDVPAPRWRRMVSVLPAESLWWYDDVGHHFDEVDTRALYDLGFDDDVMSWQVSRLSMGERQRLGLVRLLSQSPEVLLLDEPTASLDTENVEHVESVIRRYQEERDAPVLWVSHDPRQELRVAKRHYRINGVVINPYTPVVEDQQ